MRIATSSMYSQQATSIDNLETQYQNIGNTLSTGKSLNAPSDDPTQIATDLSVRTTISLGTQQETNIQAATAAMTTTDSALASLTSILQTARQAAVGAASTLISPAERQNAAATVDQYLQEAISIANSQYGSTFLFGGSALSTTAPLTTSGTPVSSVSFNGNEQGQAPLLVGKQSFTLAPSLQQAFNYNATNGSPSVFGTLINLRDTLNSGLVTDESTHSINQSGQVIYGVGSTTPTTLGNGLPTPFSITPAADSNGNYSISIADTDAGGNNHVNVYTFPAATTAVDDGSAASVVGQINANTGTTGLTATFNAQTQRLSLTNAGGGAFSVTDEPSVAGGITSTNTSNFTSLFQLTGTASLPQTLSTQLGDFDNLLDVTLNARALVGIRINALAQINTQVSTDVVDNTSMQSGIEDTDIAAATTQFSATQTALTAAYSTTTRLEAKDLFDYLS